MNDETTNNQTDQNEPTVSLENDEAQSSQTSAKTEEQETEKIASRRKSVGCLIKALIVAAIAYCSLAWWIYRDIKKHTRIMGMSPNPLEMEEQVPDLPPDNYSGY